MGQGPRADFRASSRTLRREADRDLKKRSLSLRYRAKSGEPLAKLLPEGYALVREAAVRTISQRHYDVQMIGGIALFNGCIAEMETGEGKTLTATLPLYIHALVGKGAHLATVNDYLAERDADMMRPVYDLLGLSVGVVLTKDTSKERRDGLCAATSPTARPRNSASIFSATACSCGGWASRRPASSAKSRRPGIDPGGEQPVQRGAHFCLVDEADSILIDEARTPLIIGSIGDKAIEKIVATYRWAAEVVPQFAEDEHYEYDHDDKKVELTAPGRQLVRITAQARDSRPRSA